MIVALAIGSIVPITMGVPDSDGGPQLLAVQCSVRVENVVLSGRDYRMGACWVSPSASVRQVIAFENGPVTSHHAT